MSTLICYLSGCLRKQFTLVMIFLAKHAASVRLNKLFQFIDGYRSEFNLRGFLHVGNEYAVFLRLPKPHDKFLIYELYETRTNNDISTYKPRLLAISKVPVDYIKEQLKVFRAELYRAKYVDDNVVPGTEVMTLREWQIQRAISVHGEGLEVKERPLVLRTVI